MLKHPIVIFLLILTPLLLSGCQVVNVKQQKFNVTIANERDSILSRDSLSESSLNVLATTGRDAQFCIQQPKQCVAEFRELKEQIPQEQWLSTASELFLAQALLLDKDRRCTGSSLKFRSDEHQIEKKQIQLQCLDQQLAMLDQSIRYSYAYMFNADRQPKDRIFDNRQVQIRDFYNMAIAKLIHSYNLRYQPKNLPEFIEIAGHRYDIDFSHYELLKDHPIEQLRSTYNLNFSGLRSITRRDGFGSEFALVLKDPNQNAMERGKYILDPLQHQYKNGQNPNLHPAHYLSATLAAQPKSSTNIEDILQDADFILQAYDPYRYEKITIGQTSYPLAANFSAPYGLWLAQNNLGKSAYLSLIDRDDRLTMPHLYMLEPYNPHKKVLVLIHGLASSPEAWIRLTNDIMGDPVLRENYQVWQIFYSTNMPILESRYQIYALLQQAFKQYPSNDAVLVGHSMGGIISRLLVSQKDSSQDALKLLNLRQLHQYRASSLIQQRLNIQPIPQFKRAVFLATPHQGTAFADLWFTRAARKIIKIPGAFLSAIGENLLDQNPSLRDLFNDFSHQLIQNGPTDLSHNSKFMQLTEKIQPIQGFPFHSIIGNNTANLNDQQASDGVVPYQSAYLATAVSTKVIHGGHSIQETPEAVLELRRILRLHLTHQEKSSNP